MDEERGEALPEGANPLPNRCKGRNPKTLTTDSGKVLSGITRHRNGCFDPIPIAKDRQRLPEVDTRIFGLCAHGMTTHESQSQIEAIHGIEGIEASPRPISAIACGDGCGDGLAKPAAGAMLSDRLHGRDPGRHSQVSNTAGFFASAILPDGTGDVLGLRFRANEGAAVRAKDLNAPHNRGVQDILIAAVDGLKGFPQAIEAAFLQRPNPRPASGISRATPWALPATRTVGAEAAEAALAEVEDRDPVAKYPTPAANWRRAWSGGSRSSTTRPRGARVAGRESQRAIVFEDHFPMASPKRQYTEFRAVSSHLPHLGLDHAWPLVVHAIHRRHWRGSQ